MSDCCYRADVLAHHARNVARSIDRYCVEIADEASLLGTDSHASTAVDAGVPSDMKYNRLATHIFLYSDSG